MLIPLLLYVGRDQLWSAFSTWFEIHRRLEDGAFLAHLLLDQDPAELLVQGESRLKGIKIRDITLSMLQSRTE